MMPISPGSTRVMPENRYAMKTKIMKIFINFMKSLIVFNKGVDFSPIVFSFIVCSI